MKGGETANAIKTLASLVNNLANFFISPFAMHKNIFYGAREKNIPSRYDEKLFASDIIT